MTWIGIYYCVVSIPISTWLVQFLAYICHHLLIFSPWLLGVTFVDFFSLEYNPYKIYEEIGEQFISLWRGIWRYETDGVEGWGGRKKRKQWRKMGRGQRGRKKEVVVEEEGKNGGRGRRKSKEVEEEEEEGR